jgi:hypothetical protein
VGGLPTLFLVVVILCRYAPNRLSSIALIESCQRLLQRNSAMMAELLTAQKSWGPARSVLDYSNC